MYTHLHIHKSQKQMSGGHSGPPVTKVHRRRVWNLESEKPNRSARGQRAIKDTSNTNLHKHVYLCTCQHTHGKHTHTYTRIVQINKQTSQQKLKLKQSSQTQKLSFTDWRKKTAWEFKSLSVYCFEISCQLCTQAPIIHIQTGNLRNKAQPQLSGSCYNPKDGRGQMCPYLGNFSVCGNSTAHTSQDFMCLRLCSWIYA